jgi:hypothetical protein
MKLEQIQLELTEELSRVPTMDEWSAYAGVVRSMPLTMRYTCVTPVVHATHYALHLCPTRCPSVGKKRRRRTSLVRTGKQTKTAHS